MTGVFHVSLCTLKARGEVGAGDLTNICNCDKFDTSQRKRVHNIHECAAVFLQSKYLHLGVIFYLSPSSFKITIIYF